MNAIDLLLNRVSAPSLNEPGPTSEQLDIIFRAALRAPDHAAIRPWRFITVQGDARAKLGKVFQQAALQDNADIEEAKYTKLSKKGLRAPLIVIVVATITAGHPKVPVIEQQLSAGVAAQNMMLAAFAQGIGGMWRTGEFAYHPYVKSALGLAQNEEIIGYLYLGSMPEKLKKVQELNPADFVSDWGSDS